MKIPSLTSLLFVLLLTLSCGKSSHNNSKKITRISPQQIQAIMDNQIFKCASLSGGPCPGGVSRLLIINPDDTEHSGLCSGFMVNSTTLVTNHHCVQDQSVCENTHVAVYDDGRYHQTKCKRVIKTEEDTPDANDPARKIDYTVMEVEDPFTGHTFELADKQAVEGQTVTTWVVDHTGVDDPSVRNLFESRITEFSCRANKTETFSASLVLDHCPIIEGNSGSPTMNSEGKILGVVWGGNKDTANTSQTPLLNRRASSDIAVVIEMIYFKAAIP